MANESDNIVIGANGRVLVGPKGTPLPATVDAVPNAAFKEVGYLSEDGVTPTNSRTIEGISVWQSRHHARRYVTEEEFKMAMVMREWNAVSVPLAFGGGAVVESPNDSGNYRYDPPNTGNIDERAMIIDYVDGAFKYRWVIPVGNVSDDVETQIARAGASDLPITFTALGQDGVLPWYWLSNNEAAFATA